MYLIGDNMTRTYCRTCGCTYYDGQNEEWDTEKQDVRPCPVCKLRRDMKWK